MVSRSGLNAPQKKYLETLEAQFGKLQITKLSSSLKFCLIAEGKADVYYRTHPTMEWDTAAAQCIVEIAGGAITTTTGEPLRYNKSSLLNPHFLTIGSVPNSIPLPS